tara:strand:+ start:4965 stop:5240 length:276 start_codon:yes stop_codon:yes gene_type:complete
MNQLNSAQKDQLIEQYVDLIVDSMELEDLVSYVTNDMTEFLEKLTDKELEEEIVLTNEQELYDELIDNVTSTITCINYNSVHDQIHQEATT